MHCYMPGWEVSKLRNEMFSTDYGFIVDYLAEVMKEIRKIDYTGDYAKHFELSPTLTARDRDGIVKTWSGFLKVLYPNGQYTHEEAKEIFDFSMECRKRIKDQLIRMDETFEHVDFSYKDLQSGKTVFVETLENEIHGYSSRKKEEKSETHYAAVEDNKTAGSSETGEPLKPGQVSIRDNQTGISYAGLFSPYLRGSAKITLTDPYIRLPYQFRFLMEFCVMLSKIKEEEQEIDLHIITWNDDNYRKQSEEYLYEVMLAVEELGINLTYEFQDVHDRSIVSDNGWKILLGRGLDIFVKEEARFSAGDFDQERRKCKNCTVTYLWMG